MQIQKKYSFYLLFFIAEAFNAAAQINVDRYIAQSVNPFFNPKEYIDVTFIWNMPGNIQVPLNEAINALKEGKSEQAIYDFDKVIVLDESLWMAWYYRGVCQKNLLRFTEAEMNFKKVIELMPALAEPHCELGIVYMLNKQYDKAFDELQRSIKINPALVHAYYFLAELYMIRHDKRNAQKYFQKCTEVNPRFAPPFLMLALFKLQNRTGENQIDLFNEALQADSSFAQTWFWRGLVYVNLKQYDKALSDWNRMLRFNPNDPFLLAMRGELFITMNKFDNGFSDCRKAILATEVNENKLSGRESLLMRRIDLQFAAKELIDKGYGLNENAFANLKKAFCLLLVNRREEALVAAKTAEFFQSSSTVYFFEALALDQQGHLDSAFLYFNKTLALDSDNFDAHRKRGAYLAIHKNYKGAYADLAELIRIQPQSHMVYRLRGEIKYNQTDFYGSMLDFTKYLQFDSVNAEVLTMRAVSRYKVKDISGANKDLVRAEELQPGTVEFDILPQTFLLLADTLGAIKSYRHYSDLYPQNYKLHLQCARIFIEFGKWEEARIEIGRFKKIMSTSAAYLNSYYNPNLLEMMYLEGRLDYALSGYAKAITSFDKVLARSPGHMEAKYYRAKSYISSGKKNKALSDLKELKNAGFADAGSLYESIAAK